MEKKEKIQENCFNHRGGKIVDNQKDKCNISDDEKVAIILKYSKQIKEYSSLPKNAKTADEYKAINLRKTKLYNEIINIRNVIRSWA